MGRPKGSINKISKRINVERNCNFCFKKFFTTPNRILDNRGKFCCIKCKQNAGHTKETCEKMSINNKGRPAWNKGKIMPSLRIPRNGGRYIDKDGYIFIYMPNHPFARDNIYVLEHRIIMEQKIGRYLTKEEVVHHINEIRTDNRIENLMLFPNNVEHLRHHKLYSSERMSAMGHLGGIKRHQAPAKNAPPS